MSDPATIAAEIRAVLNERPDRLDELLGYLAQIDPSAWPVDAMVERLDELAEDAPGPGADELIAYVFNDLRFIGNAANYYHPSNSLLHHVLEKRRGLPLSLAVVAAEISRRVGGTLTVIGFPGHVLVGGDGGADRLPERWFDPFNAGCSLSVDDLAEMLARSHPGATVEAGMLVPMTAADIAQRVLNNLVNAYHQKAMLDRLIDLFRIRVAVDLGADGEKQLAERRQLADLLVAAGRYDAAAAEVERLRSTDPQGAAGYEMMLERLLAHRN